MVELARGLRVRMGNQFRPSGRRHLRVLVHLYLNGRGWWLVMVAYQPAQTRSPGICSKPWSPVQFSTVSAAWQSWRRDHVPRRQRAAHIQRREQRHVRLYGQRDLADQEHYAPDSRRCRTARLQLQLRRQCCSRNELPGHLVGRARAIGRRLGNQSDAPGLDDLRHVVHVR